MSDNIRIQTPDSYEDTLLNLNSYKSKKLVEDYIRLNEPDVIVFDPLCAFTTGSLNSDSSMRQVCLNINQVARGSNSDRSVVVVHHALTGKEGAKKAFGPDRASYGRGSKVVQDVRNSAKSRHINLRTGRGFQPGAMGSRLEWRC